MKKRMSKLLLAGLLTVAVILSMSSVLAAEITVPETSGIENSGSEIATIEADQYVTYYREYNGVLQYRIWNATRGYWVNNWTNV